MSEGIKEPNDYNSLGYHYQSCFIYTVTFELRNVHSKSWKPPCLICDPAVYTRQPYTFFKIQLLSTNQLNFKCTQPRQVYIYFYLYTHFT